MGETATPSKAERDATQRYAETVVESIHADTKMPLPDEIERGLGTLWGAAADEMRDLIAELCQEITMLKREVAYVDELLDLGQLTPRGRVTYARIRGERRSVSVHVHRSRGRTDQGDPRGVRARLREALGEACDIADETMRRNNGASRGRTMSDVVDKILFSVLNTLDLSDAWAIGRREPDVLREAVRRFLPTNPGPTLHGSTIQEIAAERDSLRTRLAEVEKERDGE